MTKSPAKMLLVPDEKYWFWNSDQRQAQGAAELLVLTHLNPEHRKKYSTEKGRYDFCSFERPIREVLYQVILSKTVKYDADGNAIELDEPKIVLQANIYAANALHVWDLIWYNYSALVARADTSDIGIISESLLSGTG